MAVNSSNSGLVIIAPTTDPTGNGAIDAETTIIVFKVTPSIPITVSEIGWYCNNPSEEANFEVGIYKQSSLMKANRTNAKGTGAGWKTSSIDVDLDPHVEYQIAIISGTTATGSSFLDLTGSAGENHAYLTNQTTLTDTFGGIPTTNSRPAIYALYTKKANTGERGTKYLKTDWPHEEGLTARTQKQTGRQSNLVAEEGSKVLSRKLELI